MSPSGGRRPGPVLRDGLLLSVGTFTRLPVPPPLAVDRPRAAIAMAAAPLIGAALAAVVCSVPLVLGGWPTQPLPALVAAVCAVAALAWSSAGLHWDGLADFADGLASRRPAEEALAIMKRSDIGAIGALTMTLTAALQIASLAAAAAAGHGGAALLVAVAAGRLAVTTACLRGVPAAAPTGLGQAVAGSVARRTGVPLALGCLAAGYGLAGPTGGTAVVAGLAAGALVTATAVRRIGGITGDVLGAGCEAATAAALVTFALAAPSG